MSDSVDPRKQEEEEEVCSFSKKPSKSKNVRKRPDPSPLSSSSSEDGGNEEDKKTGAADNKLHFASESSKPQHDSETHVFQFESKKEIQVHYDSKATATLETVTVSRDKATKSHGPLRESSNVTESVTIDYQKNICKDYYRTSYCGYGDSCQFVHIRENYKSGWQMEKEWDEAEKVRKMNLAMGIDNAEYKSDNEEGDKSDDDGLPLACFKCKGPFVDPVVTKCGHYFCERCALKHHERNKKCALCDQPTDGAFKAASSEIRKRMADRERRKEKS